MQTERILASSIPPEEITKICCAIDTGIESALVDGILKCPVTYVAIWEKIVQRVYNKCSSMTTKPRKSVLSENSVQDLIHFQWETVLQEMHLECPEVLDIMLAVGVPQNKSSDKVQDTLSPRICLSYAVLMQHRVPGHSLLQRLITVLLTQGGLSKKVRMKSKYVMSHCQHRFQILIS